MDDWERYGYSSLEAYVESKAGASPPCPTCNGSGLVGELQDCGDCAGTGDWPMPPHPGAGDEDEAVPDPEDAPHA